MGGANNCSIEIPRAFRFHSERALSRFRTPSRLGLIRFNCRTQPQFVEKVLKIRLRILRYKQCHLLISVIELLISAIVAYTNAMVRSQLEYPNPV